MFRKLAANALPLLVLLLAGIAPAAAQSPPPFDDPVFTDEDEWTRWWMQAINIEEAWRRTGGAPEITIAVPDDGVLETHEEFQGGFANLSSWYENADELGTVWDGNFVTETFFHYDFFSHGTPVAAVAAAPGNNGVGSVGVCHRCGLIPIQITFRIDDPSSGGIQWGILRALELGANVINLSLGGGDFDDDLPQRFADPESRESAIARFLLDRASYLDVAYDTVGGWDMPGISFDGLFDVAEQYGTLVVVSAGNDSMPADLHSFCYHPATLCVGGAARQADGTLTPDPVSNYGLAVQVSAPGELIWAANGDGGDDGYGFHSGTSMAAPMVAGLAGLLLSLRPDLSPADLRQIIVAGAEPFGPSSNGRNTYYAGGAQAVAESNAWRSAFLRLLDRNEDLLLDGQTLKTLIDLIPPDRNFVWRQAQARPDSDDVPGACVEIDYDIGAEAVVEILNGCAKSVGPLVNAGRAVELALAGGWQDRFLVLTESELESARALDPDRLADLADRILAERSE